MKHILDSIVREMRKSGRLLNPTDFGSFAEKMDLE